MVGTRCPQKDCTGTIEDGYCNVCGHAAEKRPPSTGTSAGLVAGRNGTASHSVITGTGSSPISRQTNGSRRSRRTSSRTTRKQLGAGLITLPELPSTDPEKTVLADAKIPEHKRFCSNCDSPLKRDLGFCGKCGQKYSFLPSLRPGDLVNGQYEVKGALAYGGLGWIYLAFDKLLSRYVVLKGLLNVHDASSAAAAVAERQFLASVKHPNIVGIYNFVQHASEGFIVMEYVGGKTLKQIRQERGPLPAAEAVAYMHRILAAFSYLHSSGLVYCDFKPENVMLERDDVKLIDMGGVRRADDTQGDIYCTAGYSAPEAAEGPTPASDLYTVGRTLAVLLADFRGLTSDFRYTLPSPNDVPVFAEQESLYRLLLKATAHNPDDRFENADEMAEQTLGVLREIVALSTGHARPAPSLLFGVDPLALETGDEAKPVEPDARYVPPPLMDTSDPGARAVAGAIAHADPQKRLAALLLVREQSPRSREAKLRLAATYGEIESRAQADKLLDELASEDPWDWRVQWLRGRMRLAEGKFAEAQKDFDQVYFDLPGELASNLALGIAAERSGNLELAGRMYDLVSRVDDNYVSGAFGLSRSALARDDRATSAAALSRVPQSSSIYIRSRVETVRVLAGPAKTPPTPADLENAARVAESLSLDLFHRGEIESEILRTALKLLLKKKLKPGGATRLFGCSLQEKSLRVALERTLRSMAQLVTGEQRIELVEQANQIRPRTVI
ncbi:MAG: protein kinase [Acidobacteriaceae bacterium]|nr:protein kinase [Acidobacteriaceae bacterium]